MILKLLENEKNSQVSTYFENHWETFKNEIPKMTTFSEKCGLAQYYYHQVQYCSLTLEDIWNISFVLKSPVLLVI